MKCLFEFQPKCEKQCVYCKSYEDYFLVNKKEADNAHEPSSAPSSPPASADVDK